MKVLIAHPELDGQKTRLSSDVAAAATTSTVENNTGFATDDYVVFGIPGEELTEAVLLTSATGTTVLGHTTGPVFAHSARTQVAEIKYNQAKIYTATTETGSYSLLTTIDLTLDQEETVYDDTTGTSATWYKIKYYNETSTALSSFSVAVQGTGYTEDSLYSMTEEILAEMSDENAKDINKSTIHRHLKAGVRKLATEIFKYYPDYLRAYTTITPNGTGLDPLPSYFLGLVRVDLNYTGTVATDAYKASYINERHGEPYTTYSELSPYVSIRGTNLVSKPTLSTSGQVFIWYWAYPAPMDEDSDEHGLPYGARDVLINYALYKIWLSRQNETGTGTRSYAYRLLYREALSEYMDYISQPRQTLSSNKIDLVLDTDLYEVY
jgi:hypothetical protein